LGVTLSLPALATILGIFAGMLLLLLIFSLLTMARGAMRTWSG